jgi:hypothetical protein
LEVTAMAQLCQTGALDTAAWRSDLELTLGQTIPIAKHCALQSLKQSPLVVCVVCVRACVR